MVRDFARTQPVGMVHIFPAAGEVDVGARPEDTGVNRLYEAAAELVEAARALRVTAGRHDTWPAHPSMLGCVETVLYELRLAATAIANASPAPIHVDRTPMRPSLRGQRMRRGLDNLEITLLDAEAAASAARALCARALGDRVGD